VETFHGTDCSEETFRQFREWLALRMPVVFVSDNPAYDFQLINFYFWRYIGENPFGHSGRRIADFYAGVTVLTDARLRSIQMGKQRIVFQTVAPKRLYWAGRPP